jgi:hypothetical protein
MPDVMLSFGPGPCSRCGFKPSRHLYTRALHRVLLFSFLPSLIPRKHPQVVRLHHKYPRNVQGSGTRLLAQSGVCKHLWLVGPE